MARRRSSHRRPTRSARQSNTASAALIGGLITLCAALIVLLVKLLLASGRWYIGRWQQADQRGRVVLAGSLIGALLVLCGLGSLASTPTDTASFAMERRVRRQPGVSTN